MVGQFLREIISFYLESIAKTGSASEREQSTFQTEVLSRHPVTSQDHRGGVKCPKSTLNCLQISVGALPCILLGRRISMLTSFSVESAIPVKLITTTLVSSQKKKT